MLEQQIDLVNKDKGVLSFGSVRRNAVEDAVKDNKHMIANGTKKKVMSQSL